MYILIYILENFTAVEFFLLIHKDKVSFMHVNSCFLLLIDWY